MVNGVLELGGGGDGLSLKGYLPAMSLELKLNNAAYWIDRDGEMWTGSQDNPICITDDPVEQAKCFRRWIRDLYDVNIKEPRKE